MKNIKIENTLLNVFEKELKPTTKEQHKTKNHIYMLELTNEQYKKLKIKAINENTTLKNLLNNAINEYLK